MKKLFFIILLFPFAASSQTVIADTTYYSDGQGGWTKIVVYKNSSTTILATQSRLNDTAAAIRATVNGKAAGYTTVVLASDITNNNAVANTIADITGLSFAVTSGVTYKFKFYIIYTSTATTTGARFSINGPATTLLNYTSRYTLTATTQTINYASAYNIPAASNASALTVGNCAIIEGVITPSANGTVIARFASEIASSAIVAKIKSYVEYQIQ